MLIHFIFPAAQCLQLVGILILINFFVPVLQQTQRGLACPTSPASNWVNWELNPAGLGPAAVLFPRPFLLPSSGALYPAPSCHCFLRILSDPLLLASYSFFSQFGLFPEAGIWFASGRLERLLTLSREHGGDVFSMCLCVCALPAPSHK